MPDCAPFGTNRSLPELNVAIGIYVGIACVLDRQSCITFIPLCHIVGDVILHATMVYASSDPPEFGSHAVESGCVTWMDFAMSSIAWNLLQVYFVEKSCVVVVVGAGVVGMGAAVLVVGEGVVAILSQTQLSDADDG